MSYPRHLEQRHGRSNCQTLFGTERIPTDNHIRSTLDQVRADQMLAATILAPGHNPTLPLRSGCITAQDGT